MTGLRIKQEPQIDDFDTTMAYGGTSSRPMSISSLTTPIREFSQATPSRHSTQAASSGDTTIADDGDVEMNGASRVDAAANSTSSFGVPATGVDTDELFRHPTRSWRRCYASHDA